MEGGEAVAGALYRSGSAKMVLDLEKQREILMFSVCLLGRNGLLLLRH